MNKRFILNSKSNLTGRILSFSVLLLLLISARPLCAQTTNSITVENALPGNPSSQWNISGAGDTTIQGFATDISVNRGGTIHFKIKTPASAYQIKIFRLGYYQGNGARLIATVNPSASLPQSQPAPITDSSTGLIDYGNWAESASWLVPANAVSGIYIALLVRTDTGGSSHIAFVVRNDASTSDVLFKTSDTAWQAYNDYGGNSFYGGTGPGGGASGAGRAYKVSYNRPFNTRGDTSEDWLFNAEYPMVRWLEANGYNVTYTTSVDADRNGGSLLQHKLVLSVGHDEYWSGAERTNFETARGAGVNLAFFSGNEIFWKTRWESSIDGSGTPYRTLVCYKETHAAAKIDPTPAWTGSWRDPRFSPPSDGGKPENALSGTIFVVNGPVSDSIQVPAAYGSLRFWRNTSVASLAPGTTATFASGTLGYEWDIAPDNGFRPPGEILMSSATVSGDLILQDYGSTYATGTATHNLTLYRHPSGALVFGAGTVQWPWGLDSNHDNGSAAASPAMQQATINLFADMGVQPATLQSGLVAATASSDHTPPTSTILTPASGTTNAYGAPIVITGTASDTGGGRVAGVEVSPDGGTTWRAASGLTNWSFSWIPLQGGPVTVLSRAIDDSCNVQNPATAVNVTIGSTPLTVWPGSASPVAIDDGADNPIEVGVKFRSDVAGTITGIRFYKCAINTGTHIGDLWSSNGTLLASATFTVETPSGWQQVNFANPVSINSNTVYVASYHANNGHYSEDDNFFTTTGVDNPPLHLLAEGVSGHNGIYSYGASSVFPTSTWKSANYWVDVAFTTSATQTLVSIAVSPTNATVTTGGSQQYTAIGTYSNGSTQNITGQVTWASTNTAVATVNSAGLVTAVSPGTTAISATLGGVTGKTPLTVQPGPLSITTTSLPNGVVNSAYAATLAASGGTPPYTWSIISGSLASGLSLNTNSGAVTGTPTGTGTFNFTAQVRDTSAQTVTKALGITITTAPSLITIWPTNSIPGTPDAGSDPNGSVELGVKFRSDVAGSIAAIRFYKAAANTGTHVGNLWSSNGTLMASATFTGESASGWQQVNFGSPVSINSNTVYVASYHNSVGHYSEDDNYFTNKGMDNPPLHALTNGVFGGNGVYSYGTGNVFPTQTYLMANYWVDVVLSLNAPNTAPILPAQTNRTIAELTLLAVTNTATDANAVTYQLVNPPAGAVISTNGVITWTPAEGQGPSTNIIKTVVTDTSVPPLSATNSFTVTVNEVNMAPTLSVQTNRTIDVLTTLIVANTATDGDIPANTLTYVLAVAPTNALIAPNGVITWMPTPAQGGTTNLFITRVTDNGTPNLSATNSFVVLVNPAPIIPSPVIESLIRSNGVVTVKWCCVSNCIYRLQFSDDLGGTNWTDAGQCVQAVGSTASATNIVGASAQRFYRVLLTP